MSIEAYPLQWPVGYGRTPVHKRREALFRHMGGRVSTAEGVGRLLAALHGFGHRVKGLVVSTNVPVRRDGMPYSNAQRPEDSGVAVYFELDRKATVFCCDKWTLVGDNITAVAMTLDAMRGMERWGVSETERAFTGFAALPEKSSARTWWNVLQVARDASPEAIKAAYRTAVKMTHPDTGGSLDAFEEVNHAWSVAREERGL